MWLLNVSGQHDRRIENLTRQFPNLAGHCPVTGRYFQPWRGIKTYRFPWYLTLVSANHASSNPGQTKKNISGIMRCDVCILNPSCNDQIKISLQTSKFPSHAWLSSTVKIDKRWQHQITKTCRESRCNCIRELKQGRRGWLRERHETVVSTCLSFYSFFGGFAGFVSVFRWFRRF